MFHANVLSERRRTHEIQKVMEYGVIFVEITVTNGLYRSRLGAPMPDSSKFIRRVVTFLFKIYVCK